jgi:acyl carrier protein
MVLEDEFNVTVTDEESLKMKSVGDIVALIDKKTAKESK